MNKTEKECKDRCRRQVMAAGICESCDETGGEQHHGLFKSSQRLKLKPPLRYDPDLQFNLCPACHRANPDAPHKNNEAFLDKMKAKGGHRAYKAAKIRQIDQGPLVIVPNRMIDFNEILAGLTKYSEVA